MTRRKWLVVGSATLFSLVGAHAWLVRSGASCPMSPPSETALEAQRQRAMPPMKGERPSPTNDAFGFVLGVTTRDAFVAAIGQPCSEELSGALVRCEEADGELVARFDPKGVLVGADRMQYVEELSLATSRFDVLAADRVARFGPPARAWGERTPAWLGAPLRQVGVAYRFSDVAVDLSATHLGTGRIAIREQFRSIPRGG